MSGAQRTGGKGVTSRVSRKWCISNWKRQDLVGHCGIESVFWSSSIGKSSKFSRKGQDTSFPYRQPTDPVSFTEAIT